MTGARISPLAGKLLDPADLIRPAGLIEAYFSGVPDLSQPSQRVHFGTSGHRGSAFHNSFNEPHIVAIAQSICLYRKQHGIDGPLYLGIDTHALSRPAFVTALEVFVANEVVTMIDAARRLHPDARHLARHPRLQSRPHGRARRRRRHHAVAQSSRRWRLQVQPADRRSGRFDRHRLDRGQCQPTARNRGTRCAARSL